MISARHLVTLLESLRRDALRYEAPIDCRLCADTDDSWALLTGDVQYDIAHWRVCEPAHITGDESDENLWRIAVALIDDVENDLDEVAEATVAAIRKAQVPDLGYGPRINALLDALTALQPTVGDFAGLAVAAADQAGLSPEGQALLTLLLKQTKG